MCECESKPGINPAQSALAELCPGRMQEPGGKGFPASPFHPSRARTATRTCSIGLVETAMLFQAPVGSCFAGRAGPLHFFVDHPWSLVKAGSPTQSRVAPEPQVVNPLRAQAHTQGWAPSSQVPASACTHFRGGAFPRSSKRAFEQHIPCLIIISVGSSDHLLHHSCICTYKPSPGSGLSQSQSCNLCQL